MPHSFAFNPCSKQAVRQYPQGKTLPYKGENSITTHSVTVPRVYRCRWFMGLTVIGCILFALLVGKWLLWGYMRLIVGVYGIEQGN